MQPTTRQIDTPHIIGDMHYPVKYEDPVRRLSNRFSKQQTRHGKDSREWLRPFIYNAISWPEDQSDCRLARASKVQINRGHDNVAASCLLDMYLTASKSVMSGISLRF